MWQLCCTSSCSNCSSNCPEKRCSSPDLSLFVQLHELLAAGTVQFKSRSGCHGSVPCNHEPAEDKWHQLDIPELAPHLDLRENSEEATLWQSLEYLIYHQFLQATYLDFDDVVTIRIYLISKELSHLTVQHQAIRNRVGRRETRKHMQRLLSVISQSGYSWDGFGVDHTEYPLIPFPEVHLIIYFLHDDKVDM